MAHKRKENQVLERIETRLDKIEVTQAEQFDVLQEHVRRSLANEELLKIVREEHKLLAASVKPLEFHVAAWGGVSKALGVLGTFAALVFGAIKFLG